MEALRLRVKDLDFGWMEVTVREGKGEKDCRTVLPAPLAEPLREHLERVWLLHEGTTASDGKELASRTGFEPVFQP